MPSSDDSLVLAVPDPVQAAMSNLDALWVGTAPRIEFQPATDFVKW